MRKIPEDLANRLNSVADHVAADFDTIRMDDIAKESGIPRATLYYYFAGREEILSFLVESRLADFGRHLEAVPARGSTLERLRTHIETQLALFAENPGTTQLVLTNLTKAGTLPDLTTSADRVFHKPIALILEEGIRTGEVRAIDTEFAAIALSSAANNVALRALILDGTVDPVEVARGIAEIFWQGLRQND